MKHAVVALLLLGMAAPARAAVPDYPEPLLEALKQGSPGRACSEAERAKVVLSPETSYWLGRAATAKVLARYAQPNRVPVIFEPDTVAATYLSQVGHTLVEATGEAEHPALTDAPLRSFHFILVRDPVPNAWSFPGGFVVITDGLLMRAASEEQVAGMLAHELAHLRDGHIANLWREALCRQRTAKKDSAAQTDLLVGLALKAATETGLGTTLEADADAEATRNLKAAGYSALGLSDYLTRTVNDPSGVFKRHAVADDRTKAIADVIAAEKLGAHSAHEDTRTARFVKVMVDSGLRPDWKPVLDYYRQ